MRTVEEMLEVAQVELGPESTERLKAMLSYVDKIRKEDPKYFEGFVKRVTLLADLLKEWRVTCNDEAQI